MKSLGEFYNAFVKRGDVGIEIECEANEALPKVNGKGWVSHEDPSLRGFNQEYVTAGPIPLNTVAEHLDNLLRQVDAKKVKDSYRTSVHIHKNVLKYSPLSIWNALSAYWIMEEMVHKYCGENRQYNTFCLRLRDAEAILDACLYDISLDYPFRSFKDNDTIRYGGANLAAIRKFGTIEFRGMRGTMDKEIIKTWCHEVSSIVDTAAIQFDSPEHLLDTFYHEDKEKFVDRFLSFGFSEELKKLSPNWKDLLQNGAERIMPLAYTCDWNKWIKKMEKGFEDKVYNGTIGADRDPPPPRRPRGGAALDLNFAAAVERERARINRAVAQQAAGFNEFEEVE